MSIPQIEPRATTPGYGWRVPTLSDAPNVPLWITNLATDIEATVGRDTGQRNISTLLVNGWVQYGSPTAYPISLRRFGRTVTLSGLIVNPAAQALGGVVFTGYAGFSPTHMVFLPALLGAGNAHFSVTVNGAGQLAVGAAYTANSYVAIHASWLTNEAWPTTLPGTPALAADRAAPLPAEEA